MISIKNNILIFHLEVKNKVLRIHYTFNKLDKILSISQCKDFK